MDHRGAAGGERIAVADPMVGGGAQLFEAVRQIGAEGGVSKRAGSPYRGGSSRDWLRAKVSETAAFVIPGVVAEKAVAVAELRDGPASRGGMVSVRPELVSKRRACSSLRTPASI